MARVALIGDNSVEYVNTLLDIWNNGDCAVFIDWRIPFLTAYKMMIEANVSKCCIESKIFSKIRTEDYPSLTFEVYNNDTTTAKELPTSAYKKFHENYSVDEAVVIYSSGTTGKSKGIVLSHYAISTNADAILDYMELKDDDCIYIVKSLTHSSTLTGELLVALKSHTRLIIAPTIVPPRFVFTNIIMYEVTTICVNPKLLQLYSEEVRGKEYPLSSLKTIYVSGSILNDKLYMLAHTIFNNINIYNVYGLSEAGPRVTAQREMWCRNNSVGIPINGVDIEIVDESGNTLPNGRRGTIYVKTPSRYLYYVVGMEKLSSKYNGWLNTGDIGFIDENHELHVVGRADDIININSHKIYPSDVEKIILEKCQVKECSVVEVEYDNDTYIACLYVGESQIDRKILSNYLLPYEIPKVIIKCDEIPKTPNGKVSKHDVKSTIISIL